MEHLENAANVDNVAAIIEWYGQREMEYGTYSGKEGIEYCKTKGAATICFGKLAESITTLPDFEGKRKGLLWRFHAPGRWFRPPKKVAFYPIELDIGQGDWISNAAGERTWIKIGDRFIVNHVQIFFPTGIYFGVLLE